VLRALGTFAAERGHVIVAEGIETADQLATVQELHYDAGQGYLLGRPDRDLAVPPVDLAGLRSLSSVFIDPAA
jgi:EAL domain-containing protein (putative c-di-GMP-specific phosphodiesterase class I)